MKLAARAAERFGCDPVALLRDSGEYAQMVRQAAFEIVVEDERKRNEAERAQSRSKGR